MIRRLRLKFVLINMSIVSIMLVVILGLVFYFTSANLERESMRMLENIALQPVGLGVPGQPGEDVQLPFFKLQLGLGGQVVATGGGYYDLSDQALLDQLIAQTSASPKSLGVLEEYNLRYYRLNTPANQCVVFSDISSERATLDGLFKTCVIIGCVSFFGFLWGSIRLRHAGAPGEAAAGSQ